MSIYGIDLILLENIGWVLSGCCYGIGIINKEYCATALWYQVILDEADMKGKARLAELFLFISAESNITWYHKAVAWYSVYYANFSKAYPSKLIFIYINCLFIRNFWLIYPIVYLKNQITIFAFRTYNESQHFYHFISKNQINYFT
jgi:hypothetical protein